MTLVDRVRAYYADCNTGDAARIAAHFTEDAAHRFTRLPALEGAMAIAAQTAQAVEELGAEWTVEHGIEQGDEACIEWAMTWTDHTTGERRVTRGTEWLAFTDDGRIREVRAYY